MYFLCTMSYLAPLLGGGGKHEKRCNHYVVSHPPLEVCPMEHGTESKTCTNVYLRSKVCCPLHPHALCFTSMLSFLLDPFLPSPNMTNFHEGASSTSFFQPSSAWLRLPIRSDRGPGPAPGPPGSAWRPRRPSPTFLCGHRRHGACRHRCVDVVVGSGPAAALPPAPAGLPLPSRRLAPLRQLPSPSPFPTGRSPQMNSTYEATILTCEE